jgi:hypothetical protein
MASHSSTKITFPVTFGYSYRKMVVCHHFKKTCGYIYVKYDFEKKEQELYENRMRTK